MFHSLNCHLKHLYNVHDHPHWIHPSRRKIASLAQKVTRDTCINLLIEAVSDDQLTVSTAFYSQRMNFINERSEFFSARSIRLPRLQNFFRTAPLYQQQDLLIELDTVLNLRPGGGGVILATPAVFLHLAKKRRCAAPPNLA